MQIAAVSKEQTKNTMTLFPGLFSKACIKKHSIDIGKEVIYAYHGARRIEAVTSSPRALEGGRPTLVIKNETHHWLANNEGHEMAAVIERNSTKAKGGAARSLSITNAYEPSEDSVAQHEREAWEAERDGLAISTDVLYDSLEAPEGALLALPKKEDGSDPTDDEIKAYIAAVVTAVRGDADWLDVETIVKSVLDRKNPPSRSRRFWYNQVVAAEDAWADPVAVEAAVDPLMVGVRSDPRYDDDPLRAGWLVLRDDPIVIFFDASKSDDATALVGCRLSDGYVFTLGVWQKPPGDAGKGWVVDREAVDARVIEVVGKKDGDTFVPGRFKVVAFWGDPSHTLEDDDTRFWDGMFDRWHRRYKDVLQLWALKTGDRAHAVMWDMTSPERVKMFVAAAETFESDLHRRNDTDTAYEPALTHDGHPALKAHIKNAKRYPTKDGVSLWKGHRESPKKVDLAVAAVGARMLRRLVLNRGLDEPEKQPGEYWGTRTR